MSPSNQIFSALSFISFLLVLVPLPWHLEAWNTGTVLLMGWIALSTLNSFVNSVIWNGNVTNWAPVWCDISSQTLYAASLGITCASLCLNRRLYMIASVKKVTETRQDKIRGIIVDCCIGVLIPLIGTVLHVVVQGHRFDIFEDVGCMTTTYNVTVAYALVSAPAFILPLVSSVYAVASIVLFARSNAEFRNILASSSSSLSVNRYFRLMTLAWAQVIVGLPVVVMVTVLNVTSSPINPWISWEDTHFEFWRILQVPAFVWRANTTVMVTVEMSRWMTALFGLVFFAFFGFAEEARRHYRSYADTVFTLVGVKRRFASSRTQVTKTPGSSSFGNSPFIQYEGSNVGRSNGDLPIFVQQEVIKKRDSFDSVSDLTIRSMDENNYKPTATAQTLFSATASDRNSIQFQISSPMYLSSGSSRNMTSSQLSFPVSVRPESLVRDSHPDSFLDMSTPASHSILSSPDRPDHRV